VGAAETLLTPLPRDRGSGEDTHARRETTGGNISCRGITKRGVGLHATTGLPKWGAVHVDLIDWDRRVKMGGSGVESAPGMSCRR